MTIRIDLNPDGPILLRAEGEPFPVLQRETGGDITLEKTTALCRCGESANKPFCDGSHVAAGYSDENRCENDELQHYEAPGITVHFNRSICAGAAACVRNLPAVFKSASEDWIHPGEATVEEIAATVARCPSNALTCTVADPVTAEPADRVSIRIVPSGPYLVEGPVAFDPPRWSKNASRTRFALCRCGKTRNAPFCDYSHGEQGWSDQT
jgi:CDGSH-type Zn-finger protein